VAALVVDDEIDLDALAGHLEAGLPSYAVPLFLRLTREIEVTGTFKQKKVALRRDGFDPAVISDDVYFRNLEQARYEKLDRAGFERIAAGKVRL
jgi:hypothetical protein